MLGFVDWDGEGLTAAVVGCFDYSDIKFGRVLGEVMGAGHAWVTLAMKLTLQ